MQSQTTLAIGLIVGIVIGSFGASIVRRDSAPIVASHPTHRPTVFVGRTGVGNGLDESVSLTQMKEIWQACPNTPLITWNHKEADYTVAAYWVIEEKRWWTEVSRSDSAVLSFQQSPDFAKLMRDACMAISKDASAGLPVKPNIQAAERFDVRDIRNGTVMTTALFDKQTGNVWIWSKAKNGNTEFIQEDVIPKPEHVLPELEVK